MDNKADNTPTNLWDRRSANTSKPSLSTRDSHSTPNKRYPSNNNHNSLGRISTSAVASPTAAGASSAFGLGSGAFASFGSANKPPKTPGSAFDFAKAGPEKKESQSPAPDGDDKDARKPPMKSSASALRPSAGPPESNSAANKDNAGSWPLKYSWVMYYRPPTHKTSDYEKSIKPLCRMGTAQDFWKVYSHLKRPSALPTVSDYHLFKEGIRPVWEDEENRRGGKFTMRLKKGVADRYWEDLLLAIIGDQFLEAGEEVCGAVVSVRTGEDVISIWTKNNGGRNVKIRETIKRLLDLPADTNLQFKSHDDSITQGQAVNQARQEKGNQMQNDKRRNTIAGKNEKEEAAS